MHREKKSYNPGWSPFHALVLGKTARGVGAGHQRLPGTSGKNSLLLVYMEGSWKSGCVGWDSGNYYGNISSGDISRF